MRTFFLFTSSYRENGGSSITLSDANKNGLLSSSPTFFSSCGKTLIFPRLILVDCLLITYDDLDVLSCLLIALSSIDRPLLRPRLIFVDCLPILMISFYLCTQGGRRRGKVKRIFDKKNNISLMFFTTLIVFNINFTWLHKTLKCSRTSPSLQFPSKTSSIINRSTS